jgi:PAS domain S-box-containing protein
MLSWRLKEPTRARAELPAWENLLIFYIIYLAASSFGQWLMVIPDIEITVWPPNGVVMAVLLLTPRSTWPWWLLPAAVAELTSNYLWFHNPLLPAVGYVLANVLEVTFAAHFLTALFPRQDSNIGSLRWVFGFLAIGVLAAPLVGATVGSAVSMVSGKAPFATVWPLWWLGDATGVLIAVPLVFSAIQILGIRKLPSSAQSVEGALIGLLIALAWRFVIVQQPAYAFLMFVPVLWAAVRFEITGTAIAIFTLICMIGLFDGPQPAAQHAIFQILILLLATTGYVVAAAVRQYRMATEELAQSNNVLELRVHERMHEVEIARRQFETMFENAAVGMTILDPRGTLVRVNPNFAEMLGYQTEEMENRPIDSFTHPDDIEKSLVARGLLQREARDSYVLEKRFLCKNGEVVWGLASVSCVRDAGGSISFVIKIVQNINARKERDHARQMLMQEVNHRSKNLLSLIQAIARQTGAVSPNAFYDTFSRRLHALAANQDLLVRSSWENVQLQDLVRAQLEPFGITTGTQFTADGPALKISARAAQALGMALHELATNAAKYGSLSTDAGKVEISWSVAEDTFTITWQETGGPEITHPPESKGFGTTVIDALIRSTLDASVTIDFAPSGLVWTCSCPMNALQI